MTTLTTPLFQSSSQVVAWLRSIARPMIDSEGNALSDSGIARVTIPKTVVNTLLNGGAQARDTGKWTVYNFIRDGKAYTLKVHITFSPNKECVFTWDHRDNAAPEPEPEPQFEISLRTISNRINVHTGSWSEVNAFKNSRLVTAWEIARRVAGQRQVIAQSATYHTLPTVQMAMRYEQNVPHTQIVDGLLVDIRWNRVYIYFTDNPDPIGSCLRIFEGHAIGLDGNVTLENYEGFVRAAALAKTYLKSQP